MFLNERALEYTKRQLGLFDAGYFKDVIDKVFSYSHVEEDDFEAINVVEEIRKMLRRRNEIPGTFDIASFNRSLRDMMEYMADHGVRCSGNDTNSSHYDMNDEFEAFMDYDVPDLIVRSSNNSESVVYGYLIVLWMACNYPTGVNEYTLKGAIDYSKIKESFKIVEHIHLAERLERDYQGFKDDFNREILKSIKPLDLTGVPAYAVETSKSLFFHQGKAYDKGDIMSFRNFKGLKPKV